MKMSKFCDRRDSMGRMMSGDILATSERRLASGSTPTPHWEIGTLPLSSAPSALTDSRPTERISSAMDGGLRPSSCACSARHIGSRGMISTLRFW